MLRQKDLAGDGVESGDAVGVDDKVGVVSGRPTEPSARPTRHQAYYLLVLDGLVPMAVSGGIGFALAYVMYAGATKTPVQLFSLPRTLAGDAAVTIVVQCVLAWFVEAILVDRSLSHRAVQPIGWAGREPKLRLLRALFLLPADPEAAPAAKVGLSKPGSLAQHLLRSLLAAAVTFVALWPATVGLLALIGQRDSADWRFRER